jgi:transcriptional regulator with XRE-family HTH domain
MTGRELRILRIRAGLRLFELAAKAGMSPSKLSLIECERKPASTEDMRRLLEALRAVAAEGVTNDHR